MMGPGVFGVVTVVNGNTITVVGKIVPANDGSAMSTETTWTVDSTNAKVFKNGSDSTVASVLVGDTVMVVGTVNGSNVVAKFIHDGRSEKGVWRDGDRGPNSKTQGRQVDNGNMIISGNGQPVVAGTIATISGSTLTITNKSSVTYTVDVTNAKIIKAGITVTAANLSVGDMVVVQGAVNGSSIVASSVIDQAVKITTNTNGLSTTKAPGRGFFGGVGSFFSKLFGF
jgi:hypothetical protein